MDNAEIEAAISVLTQWAQSAADMATFSRRIELVHMLQHEVSHGG